MSVHRLSDIKIKQAKIGAKLADGAGLHLYVEKNGNKYFRLRFRINGKPSMISLGQYNPGQSNHTTLAVARNKALSAKELISKGIHPSGKQTKKTNNNLETIANTWLEIKRKEWGINHTINVESTLNRFLLPQLGSQDISQITSTSLREVINSVQSVHTKKRIKGYFSNIAIYAIEGGLCETDISSTIKITSKAPRTQHRKSMKLSDLTLLFEQLEACDSYLITKLAIEFIILTALRTKEVRYLRWEDLELGKKGLIRIPASRMKKHREHLVPLSLQAQRLLHEVDSFKLGSDYIFASQESKSGVMDNHTFLRAIYALGWKGKATIHGFRSLFSTTAHENEWPSDAIEIQLSHYNDSSVKAAYNSALYINKRRELMNWWGNLVEGYKNKFKMST